MEWSKDCKSVMRKPTYRIVIGGIASLADRIKCDEVKLPQ